MLLLLILVPAIIGVAQTDDNRLQVVTREQLEAALAACNGYDPTVTTNASRFHAEVILHLARQARTRQPDGPPLLIKYEERIIA